MSQPQGPGTGMGMNWAEVHRELMLARELLDSRLQLVLWWGVGNPWYHKMPLVNHNKRVASANPFAALNFRSWCIVYFAGLFKAEVVNTIQLHLLLSLGLVVVYKTLVLDTVVRCTYLALLTVKVRHKYAVLLPEICLIGGCIMRFITLRSPVKHC